ncbi:MAG: hypothetical protein KAR35_04220, partial [Candidatus Heimdallarchaeota archaeon]|nr:hypothetical protein [Candidatus Heimdallarchaeota archaeon]MCK5048560.1 hypothetical protein [Candidatus Heimdallarchaeota archaeon]
MNREEQGELPVSLEQLEPLDHVDQLILQGKLEEAIEIIEGREMEEGLGELRWRIVECRYCNIRGEFEQVIEIVEEIKKELEVSVEQKGEQTRKRIRIDAL